MVHEIKTSFGNAQIVIEGDVSKACLFTFHDIGMNNTTCFPRLFNCAAAARETLINDLTRVHINAPGQEPNAPNLPEDAPPLTCDGLVELIEQVRQNFNINRFVGMGVGLGAYLMLDYAVKHPNRVAGLILFGATTRPLGWIEWAKRSLSSRAIRVIVSVNIT